jgi:hypothetical protein
MTDTRPDLSIDTTDAAVDVIDVPHGQHGFDRHDHVQESKSAVCRAFASSSPT